MDMRLSHNGEDGVLPFRRPKSDPRIIGETDALPGNTEQGAIDAAIVILVMVGLRRIQTGRHVTDDDGRDAGAGRGVGGIRAIFLEKAALGTDFNMDLAASIADVAD